MILLSPFFLLGLVELLLRLFWQNPYLQERISPEFTRFHTKNIEVSVRTDGLYEGGKNVMISMTDDMAISDGSGSNRKKRAVAVGGSTTADALSPEGRRWPDLLAVPTVNYGASANTTVDSYYNLLFLLENNVVKPEIVFMMHAVNDLHHYLKNGRPPFAVEGWNRPPVNMLQLDNPHRVLFLGIRLSDSWLLSFLRYRMGILKGHEAYGIYLGQRKTQDKLQWLGPEEFSSFKREFTHDFLPARADVYSTINNLLKNHGVEFIILTQPNNYREDYVPYREDLRLFPIVAGKKMSMEQTAGIFKILNDQNRELARRFNRRMIDVEACFAKLNPSPLFYDSVHYTEQGSLLTANCINAQLDD